MVALPIPLRRAADGDRSARAIRLRQILLLGLVCVSLVSIGTGPAGISLGAILADLTGGAALSLRDSVVLWDIRLPRLGMGLLIGAGLAVSGALMQGLFRNPLADPGIVGVGSGAGLGAVLALVLGGMLPVAAAELVGRHLVAAAAFFGGWLAVLILYRIATRSGRTSVATMLLGGIALGALAGALTGGLIYIADDRQLRDLTFWGMGSLAGASWIKLATALPLILPVLVLSTFLAKGLNALALGEAAAGHMGLPVQRLKRLTIFAVAAATGASVAVAGGIGFIGIVVPHVLRLASGPDHRYLLPNAALLGSILLVAADMVARSVVAPAELPIGIVTAAIGAPVFLWILLRSRGLVDL